MKAFYEKSVELFKTGPSNENQIYEPPTSDSKILSHAKSPFVLGHLRARGRIHRIGFYRSRGTTDSVAIPAPWIADVLGCRILSSSNRRG